MSIGQGGGDESESGVRAITSQERVRGRGECEGRTCRACARAERVREQSNDEGEGEGVSSLASRAHPYLSYRGLGPSRSPAVVPWSVRRPPPGTKSSTVAWIRE